MHDQTPIAQKAREALDQARELTIRRRYEDALLLLQELAPHLPTQLNLLHVQTDRLLADSLYHLGQTASALRCARKAEQIAAKLGEPIEQAESLLLLADILRDRNEFKAAQKACRDAESLFRRAEHREGECSSLNKLAGLYVRQADYPQALEALLEAVELARQLDDRKRMAYMLGNLGRIYGFTGQLAEAESHLRSNIELSGELGDELEVARAQMSLASLKTFTADYREAQQLAESAKTLCVSLKATRDELIALITIGELQYRSGHPDDALGTLQSVVIRASHVAGKESALVARAQRHLAEAALATGRHDFAAKLIVEAIASFTAIGNKAELGALAGLQARLAKTNADLALARQLFEKGLGLLEQSGNQLELIDLMQQAGQSSAFGEKQSILYLFRVEEFMARNRATTRLEQIGQLIASPHTAVRPQLSLPIVSTANGADYPTLVPSILAFKRQLQGMVDTDLPVLLTGETGVGKDRMARYYHSQVRPAGPFVAVNCASIPETLLESELFGYRKGAFSGADQSRDGLLLAANHGVLFLDEIGDMPLALQAKLLGVLERRRFMPLGSTVEVELDIRIVAATNQPLRDLVKEGRFRSDLYYRLDGISFHLPPLRERAEDLPLLIDLFMQRHGLLAAGESAARPLVAELASYDWPGNIRQLENKIKWMALTTKMVAEGDLAELGRSMLEPLHRDNQRSMVVASVSTSQPTEQENSTQPFGRSLFERVEELERQLLVQALSATRGNKSEAARLLGVHEATVRVKMKRYGLLAESTIH